MTLTTTLTAGIDTAKHKLDVAIHGQAGGVTVAHGSAGWNQLAEHLRRAGVARVGIEATGGYQRGVTRHRQQAGCTVLVLQPLQVRAFARLRLQRAKNDRIDAVLIAACTQLLDANPTMPPDPRFDALADHLTFIEQIEEDIVRIKTRLEQVHDKRLRRIDDTDISRLEKRRDTELKRLVAELRGHPDLARRFDRVLSIPSIGERTALTLVVRMPELGQVSREQAAALAGLAPFVQQSGTQRGEAHIAGGRSRLRRALYAAALPGAFRWSPELKVEPGTEGAVCPPDGPRQEPQMRAGRLRPQAADLRQHGGAARHAVAAPAGPRMMRHTAGERSLVRLETTCCFVPTCVPPATARRAGQEWPKATTQRREAFFTGPSTVARSNSERASYPQQT